MRVGIDLTALLPQSTGVDNYMKSLVHSLARLDRENAYVVFVNAEDRRVFRGRRVSHPPHSGGENGSSEGLPRNFRVLPLSLRPRATRLFFQQVLQPLVLQACRVDVLHSPSFIMPFCRGRQRHLLTIHDMTSFSLPHTHPPLRRSRSYKRAVAWSIRHADLVSVPSRSVRDDILGFLPDVSPPRIRVIASGIRECFHPQASKRTGNVLARLRLNWPYILHVGTVNPRKNLERLIDAYSELITTANVPEHLVLAGPLGWNYESLLRRVAEPELRQRVHFLGYVPDDDLPYVYAGARLLVYPSLQEGFGFPPLEAMASGVPVLASRCSSLAENLAGAAELVPPDDVEGLRHRMARLLSDRALRRQLVREGFERAARFRWNDFARQTLECYRGLVRPA